MPHCQFHRKTGQKGKGKKEKKEYGTDPQVGFVLSQNLISYIRCLTPEHHTYQCTVLIKL